MAAAGTLKLPIYTRIGDRERQLGTIECPVDLVDGRVVIVGKPGVMELVDDVAGEPRDWQDSPLNRPSSVDIPQSINPADFGRTV